MEITYKRYAVLAYCEKVASLDLRAEAVQIPFKGDSQKRTQFLQTSVALPQLLLNVAAKQFRRPMVHIENYYLETSFAMRLGQEHEFFRCHNYFMENISEMPSTSGIFLLGLGQQMVYEYLDTLETVATKKRPGCYIAAAKFNKDIFLGFEMAYIKGQELDIHHEGCISKREENGSLVSLVIALLGYRRSQKNYLAATPSVNKTAFPFNVLS
ncbi:MAG: hypothetical protein DI539_27170 [Flavobacterium psychrophilum]|nr:MAG: hypothetical protein DI539_27170 [Flavobacterium psychrophilum]